MNLLFFNPLQINGGPMPGLNNILFLAMYLNAPNLAVMASG
jgi:hypothetical protein